MPQFPDTRNTLLASLRADETGAWMEFTAIYETVIYRVATKTGLQHADALDVTQEVLAKVYRKIGEWDTQRTDGRFRGWLHRLAMNASIDVIRRRKRQAIASGDSGIQHLLGQQPATSDDESTQFQLEYKRAVFKHVAARVQAETTDAAWRCFCRTSVDGAAPKDVAQELGVSVGSVYAHKCRVLAQMRAAVQRLTTETSLTAESFTAEDPS
jgi:RNA polymerase sigma-70 factor (ECF subfamily)